MSYRDALQQAWKTGGAEGALAFLRAIFHDPANQKLRGSPTDYLSEERDDSTKTPAAGFDQMVRLYVPKTAVAERVRHIIDNLEQSRAQGDAMHRLQPFNGLKLDIKSYDHGSAILTSVHIDAKRKTWKPQYGLNHTLVYESDNYDEENDDDEQSYDFIYALENKKIYAIAYEGEKLTGKRLFVDVRAAQYGRYAGEVIEALLQEPRFAAFPKQLPFYFVLVDEAEHSHTGGSWKSGIAFLPPLTAASLAKHPQRDALLASAEPLPELGDDERWTYAMRFIDQPETPEYASLVELTRTHERLFTAALELAQSGIRDDGSVALGALADSVRARARTSDFVTLLFAAAGDTRRDAALELAREALAKPVPELPRNDLTDAAQLGEECVREIYAVSRAVPESVRPLLQTSFDAARAKLAQATHPVLRVLAMEAEMLLEHGDEAIIDAGYDEVTYDIDELPHGYVEAVAASIDEMPPTFEGYGYTWSFAFGRLRGLGKRASAAAPAVLAILDRYCGGERRNDQALEGIATLLMELGVDEPPKLIRDYAEKASYHGIEGYDTWANAGRERAWLRLTQAFAAKPFAIASEWEERLYDSEKALKLFAERVLAADTCDAMIGSIEQALRSGATPLLLRFVYALLGKKVPDKAEHATRTVRLLRAMPQLDDEWATRLWLTELLLLRLAIDAGDSTARDIHRELVTAKPSSPLLAFFGAELTCAEDDERAARETSSAIEMLSRDDVVYRKAFFQITGNEAEDWSRVTVLDGYVVLRLALERFRDSAYHDGVFSGGSHALESDPFYVALTYAFKKGDAEFEKRRAEARTELEVAAQIRAAADDELVGMLRKDHFGVSFRIAQRLLAASPRRFAPKLLQIYDWFRKDEEQRLSLVKLYWPSREMRPLLVGYKKFWRDLPWFYERYPSSTQGLVRETFAILNDQGLHATVLDVTKKLSSDLVVACFLSVDRAIRGVGDPAFGISTLERILKKTSKKKPEYVLIASNLGVMHIRGGDKAAAETVFDELFAMDFSRFEPEPEDEGDDIMSELLGGNLNAQIIDVFQQYYASAKFNVACLYAMTDRPEQAVAALAEAQRRHPGPYHRKKLTDEQDFDGIRKHPLFVELLARSASGEAS